MMKNSEIIQLSDSELRERIEEETLLLTKMKLNHAVSPLDNPHKLSSSKKTLARLKTELRMRNIKQANNG